MIDTDLRDDDSKHLRKIEDLKNLLNEKEEEIKKSTSDLRNAKKEIMI